MKKTLVVGASTNPSRYAYMAIKKLLQYNHPVVALGRRKGLVDGVEIEIEKLPFKDIDTITLYIGPKHQPEFYEYIVSLKPKRVIFNPGTENDEFYKVLNENNIDTEIACTLVLLSTNQY